MSHALLKKLQVLRDKLELRRDDLSVSEAALADESRELQGRREQLELVNGQIASCTREMDELGVRGRRSSPTRRRRCGTRSRRYWTTASRSCARSDGACSRSRRRRR